MFAVISTGGKQYKVANGDVLSLEKLSGETGDVVEFDHVLMQGDKIGTPEVKGAKVKAEVIEQTKGDKVIVFKKKRRHNYRRKKGHRQELTLVRITDIGVAAKKKAAPKKAAAKKAALKKAAAKKTAAKKED